MGDRMTTVVLVDDAPDVRALMRMRLRLTNRFEVVGEAGTGADAVRLVAELRPALLVLDVSMPDMDGIDALTQITASVPETRVVMFSGFEEHGLADRARELGAVDFIEKSVPIAQVVERLEAAVRGTTVPPAPPSPLPVHVEPVLQEHLERFRAAFDQAAIGMATLTLTGRIVRANAALDALTGAGPGTHVGMLYQDLAHERDRDRIVRALGEVGSGRRDVDSVEHSLGDRSVVATIAVVRDSAGSPLYLFLQVQDVTERRAAQEELRRSEERFRLLVEAVGDYAIFMLDPDGRIASWNIGAQRAKGYTADEIIGQHFSIFYLPEAVAVGHPQRELEIAVAEGRYEEEGWRVRKDGTTFWANVVITAMRDELGQLVGFAKVTRDVTERRRLLDELQRAADERADVLSVAAHELRTPVAIVKGYASMLEGHWHELDDADRVEMIASLHRTGQRLGRLVDDLFTAARLESGVLEVRPTGVDLVEVATEVARDLDGDVDIDGPPVVVSADRGRVQQMVWNYVTNAIRYGAAPIRITIAAQDGHADLAVVDAGPGISDELLPRLFRKFSSGGSDDGSGLGLFIVRELARAQHGDAWYEPAPGGGARFVMRLPLRG